MSIRVATTDDAAEVQAIYAPVVQDTTISFDYEPPFLAVYADGTEANALVQRSARRRASGSTKTCDGLDASTGAQCGLLQSVDGLVEAEQRGSWISKAASVFLGEALTARRVFPQNSTVLLTADSSAQSYLGYFWLGWHVAGRLCSEDGPALKKSSLCAAPN